MKNHRSIRQAGGTPGGAHRAPPAGTARRRVARGILVLGLTLGSLGAAALALPGHAGAGPAQVSAHQHAGTHARPAAPDAAVSKTTPRAWMY